MRRRRESDDESGSPVPPPLRTEVFQSRSTPQYLFIQRTGLSVTSEVVEKRGFRDGYYLMYVPRTQQTVGVSKEIYDSLELIPNEAVQKRDRNLETALRLVSSATEVNVPRAQSFLTQGDFAALAQTNRVILEQALRSNAQDFRKSDVAVDIFVKAIQRNDQQTIDLFLRYNSPVCDSWGDIINAFKEAARNNNVALLRQLFVQFFEIIFVPNAYFGYLVYDYSEEDDELIDGNILSLFKIAMELKSRELLLFLTSTPLRDNLEVLPDEEVNNGIFDWILKLASKYNWEEAVRILSEKIGSTHGAYRNFTAPFDESLASDTPLFYWIRRNNLPMVQEILRRRGVKEQRFMLECFGSNPQENPGSDLALIEALSLGPAGESIVEFILSKSIPGQSMCGILSDICARSLCAAVFLDAEDINKANYPHTHEASLRIVKLIVEDILVNKKTDGDRNIFDSKNFFYSKISPLIWCVVNREDDVFECTELLLISGCKPNSYDLNGNTPLIAACTYRDAKLASLLLDYKADPNLERSKFSKFQKNKTWESKVKYTPLLAAAENYNKELIELLLSRGATKEKTLTLKYKNGEKEEIDFLDAFNQASDDLLYKWEDMIKFLVLKHGFKTTQLIVFMDVLRFFSDQNGRFSEEGKQIIKFLIDSLLSVQVRREMMNDIINQILHETIKEEEFNQFIIERIEFILSLDTTILPFTIDKLFFAINYGKEPQVRYLLSKRIDPLQRFTVTEPRAFTGNAIEFADYKLRTFDAEKGAEQLQHAENIRNLLNEYVLAGGKMMCKSFPLQRKPIHSTF